MNNFIKLNSSNLKRWDVLYFRKSKKNGSRGKTRKYSGMVYILKEEDGDILEIEKWGCP